MMLTGKGKMVIVESIWINYIVKMYPRYRKLILCETFDFFQTTAILVSSSLSPVHVQHDARGAGGGEVRHSAVSSSSP